MTKCPYCGKENSEESANCISCGTRLKEPVADAEVLFDPVDADPRRARGQELMLQGVIWFIVGTAVTLFSYIAAVRTPYGGHYVVAYGAIAVGASKFFEGGLRQKVLIRAIRQQRCLTWRHNWKM